MRKISTVTVSILGAFAIYLVQACGGGPNAVVPSAQAETQSFTKIAEVDIPIFNGSTNSLAPISVDMGSYRYVVFYTTFETQQKCGSATVVTNFLIDPPTTLTGSAFTPGLPWKVGSNGRVPVDGPTLTLYATPSSGSSQCTTVHAVIAGTN